MAGGVGTEYVTVLGAGAYFFARTDSGLGSESAAVEKYSPSDAGIGTEYAIVVGTGAYSFSVSDNGIGNHSWQKTP